MKIQNLNAEELEQLQTLLNKMNPTQDKDPVNKMIDDIIEKFDFNKVWNTLKYLGWR